MTLEVISLPTGPIVVTSSTSRVEFSPSQVREVVQEALLDGDTLKSPQQLLTTAILMSTTITQDKVSSSKKTSPIDFPGDKFQSPNERPFLRKGLFRNGVKLAKDKNPDRW
ncbi:hypothetical protein MMC31_003454 [Peltigera leucophlebia]|nr:hypothetical protein [Peltigera leucophlebia]